MNTPAQREPLVQALRDIIVQVSEWDHSLAVRLDAVVYGIESTVPTELAQRVTMWYQRYTVNCHMDTMQLECAQCGRFLDVGYSYGLSELLYEARAHEERSHPSAIPLAALPRNPA